MPTPNVAPTTPARALRLVTALVVGTALLCTDALAQGRIDVVNSRGQVANLTGTTVVSETLEQVQYRRGDSDRTESRDTARIVRIVYGDGSETYEKALAARSNGDLRNAATLLTSAAGESDPPWQAPLAVLALAEVHGQRGPDHVAEARAAAQRFLDTWPEHRLAPEALLLKARFASALGDRTAADESVSKVLEFAGAGRITPDWAVRAHLANGQALLEAGDATAATTAFSAAEQTAAAAGKQLEERPDLERAIADLALEARSGTGAAMLAGGDVAGARRYFQQLAQDGDSDAAIAASAANGLAEADFIDKKLKQAQVGFAQVAVTGAAIPGEHAKALYYLGRCSDALAEAGVERTGRARAREYYQEVVARYPSTHWARLARETLP